MCCLIGFGKQSGIISKSGSAAKAKGSELVKQCGGGVKGLGWNCLALGSTVGIGDSGDPFLVWVDQLFFQF